MSKPPSPADARISVMRALQALFTDLLDDGDDEVAISEEERDRRAYIADELSLEFLDTLGLEITSVDADGSFVAKITLDDTV